jgi:5'-methylthioadenosine phosphorylase
MATDYDCWHSSEAEVSVDMIIETLTANTKLAKEIIRRLLPGLTGDRHCACQHALKYAIMTDRRLVPPATMEALSPMLAKYQ